MVVWYYFMPDFGGNGGDTWDMVFTDFMTDEEGVSKHEGDLLTVGSDKCVGESGLAI